MPLYRVNGKLILFVHVPKAGGRSVERALKAVGTESFLRHRPFKQLPCSPQHFHAELLDYLFSKDFFDFTFAVVRHPLDRILSEYRMRTAVKAREGQAIPDVSRWIQSMLSRYSGNSYMLDNHLRPQIEFVKGCTKVYKLESDLPAMYGDLTAVTGAQITPPREIVGQSATVGSTLSITKQTLDLVCEFYRGDFEEFGYEPSDSKYWRP